MSENELNISPFSSEKERKLVSQMKSITSSDESRYYEVGDISSSSSIGSPIRSIFCLKEKADMKRIEEIEDCFILEFDPYEPLDVFNLSMNNNLIDGHPDGANDLFLIAEKGQVWIALFFQKLDVWLTCFCVISVLYLQSQYISIIGSVCVCMCVLLRGFDI